MIHDCSLGAQTRHSSLCCIDTFLTQTVTVWLFARGCGSSSLDARRK